MIISASRRTDIPAFFGEWFMNRIREGFVCVKNPFNTHAISKVPLAIDVTDIIVFWTKDAKNFIKHLDKLDELGYKYYFQFTLTPYDKSIEQGLRDKEEIIKTFIELSKRIGKEKVIWRYDPILIFQDIDVKYHIEKFKEYAGQLADFTQTVIISFLDDYKKVGSRKQNFRKPTLEEMYQIGNAFSEIAKANGLQIKTCAEEITYRNGIEKASCIDAELIKLILEQNIDAAKDKNQRKECLCVESIDIGEYDSCLHLCQYCYANVSSERIKNNIVQHDVNSPLLIGKITSKDEIKPRKVKSIKINQRSLFDI